MIKTLMIAGAMISCAAGTNNVTISNDSSVTPVAKQSLYDFKVEGLDGNTIDFSSFKGKKILIVNTASECGFTKQYEGLDSESFDDARAGAKNHAQSHDRSAHGHSRV